MGKSKDGQALDDSQIENGSDEVSYEEKLKFVSVIAQPMASKKLAGRVYKLVKKASKHKKFLLCGVKVVQQKLRRGERGIVIFAGDVSPIEIMCHLPAVCEEKELPYIYIPSRLDLGSAMGSLSTICMLILEHADYKDSYDKVLEDIKKVPKVL
ncbi:hypothetical protein Pcinc_018018 [Petrolisthes cinctipes]|uniref:Ribosomal protein eL8/eL30/eS12/Gadd45 domain-containing protein n=1 Tax=Petrolisthes cinctipes TaxID=88211 RepID=A0AAE1FT17_PETCI|nr:hypothetical protein Pcinc_018018 [Petrolisthes cinctipes]